MILPIYTYNDKIAFIQTDDSKKIDCLSVILLSGDEVVTVYYEDGTVEEYDADRETGTCTRIDSIYGGQYRVEKDQLVDWTAVNEAMGMGPYEHIQNIRMRIFRDGE